MADGQDTDAEGGRTTRPLSPREASAAARVMVVVDRKLGRTTPEWVRELAARPRHT